MTEKYPEFDTTARKLTRREFQRRWQELGAPLQYTLVEDDGLRRQMYEGWLREVNKRRFGTATLQPNTNDEQDGFGQDARYP